MEFFLIVARRSWGPTRAVTVMRDTAAGKHRLFDVFRAEKGLRVTRPATVRHTFALALAADQTECSQNGSDRFTWQWRRMRCAATGRFRDDTKVQVGRVGITDSDVEHTDRTNAPKAGVFRTLRSTAH